VDGDALRIVEAWTRYIASDGCIRVDEAPSDLARKLIVDALVALGAHRRPAGSPRKPVA
jgi:hypothetical protein